MSLTNLERTAATAELEYLAASRGLSTRLLADGEDDGFRALLAPEESDEEVFFAVAPRDLAYVSISLVLVVDEAFFRENVEEILAVTSRYEVCTSLARDGKLADGEVYLNLALRLFRAPLTLRAFSLAVENLRAARDALAQAFP